jgi:predicted phage tail protein
MDIKEGDITITPIPAGSKSGPAKILAAIALTVATAGAFGAFATVYTGTAAGTLGTGLAVGTGSMAGIGAGLSAAMASGWGLMALSVATNLAITGITQMMTPDPSTDSDQEQSYLFNGAEQNLVEGDPVPVLYGRLRVPGQPVSFEIAGARLYNSIGFGIMDATGQTMQTDINFDAVAASLS